MADGTWAIGKPSGEQQVAPVPQTIASAGIALLRAHAKILTLVSPSSVDELHARLQVLAGN
jgi:hypothetical protein